MQKLFGYLVVAVIVAVGAAYAVKTLRSSPPKPPASADIRPTVDTPATTTPAPSAEPESTAELIEAIEADAPEVTMKPLNCSASIVRRDDTLTIRPAGNVHRYLSIQPPGGNPFIVIFPGQMDGRTSLMPAEQFRTMTSLDLKISELQAAPWVYQQTQSVPVFTSPGEYRINVGENLERDTGELESCTVQLVE